jgi:outer membrane protein OmpA-like peptidoglycan-associated protein
MGGLDIYRARIKDGVISKLENLGFPINSSQDDFAYSLTSTKKRFLSSNREGGLGNDDIYSYIDTEKIRVPLDIQILDKETNQPLANAVITITDSNGKPIKIQTDENGKFNIYLDENSDYNLLVDKTNYISESTKISTQGIDIDGKLNFDLALNKIVIEKPIVLENIYYDFNKAKIKPSSFATLNKLVEMLKDNPTLWVELSAHTDNQGDDKYNQWLSEMRAKSAVFYIVKNGIDVSRIKSKGYGESMPIEKCNTCTIKQNQLNRRTEFKIVKQ